MNITLIHISDSDKHFADANQEYTKRMWTSCTIITIKPVKHGTRDQIIMKETELVIKKLETRNKKNKHWDLSLFLLSIEWKSYTTEQLSRLLPPWSSSIFLIWWPYGFDEKMLTSSFPNIKKICFWKQTMPHGLAKLVLLEQIYRCWTLQSGKTYHY